MALPGNVVTKVRDAFKGEAAAVPILRDLSSRRAQKTIDIYRVRLELIRGGFHFSDLEISKFFTKLQKIGVGKFAIQELPKHSSFTWTYSMPDVAAAALGILGAAGNEHKSVKTILKASPLRSGGQQVAIPLPNTVVTVTGLPEGFTAEHADMVARALKALAAHGGG